METYDLLYIGLIGFVLFVVQKAVRRLLKYSAQDKNMTTGRDKNSFFFFSYHWLTKIVTNAIILWTLSLQPYDKGGIYIITLMSIYAFYTIIIVAKWPSEIMTIDTDTLNFRFRSSRNLKQIKGVVSEDDTLIIYAKDHPKKTKLFKKNHRGDWETLRSAIFEFASQNPAIEIKGTAPVSGMAKADA